MFYWPRYLLKNGINLSFLGIIIVPSLCIENIFRKNVYDTAIRIKGNTFLVISIDERHSSRLFNITAVTRVNHLKTDKLSSFNPDKKTSDLQKSSRPIAVSVRCDVQESI